MRSACSTDDVALGYLCCLSVVGLTEQCHCHHRSIQHPPLFDSGSYQYRFKKSCMEWFRSHQRDWAWNSAHSLPLIASTVRLHVLVIGYVC
ncbi:hypothetical protein M413DRAFT_448367 [Hebeloma cylindrosporum]|uniref:Uncharacterized protein n=1 Tax=Hebeloma cylindrosporum TaxID=76867 RepID=A0A0C2Y943_HEBCY|nr:hypothetical protein M413DRAFT_448367 [Hebeloma cylindrosporum h7]